LDIYRNSCRQQGFNNRLETVRRTALKILQRLHTIIFARLSSLAFPFAH
jgi:hypothetical protein